MIKRIKEVLMFDNGFMRAYNDEVLFHGKIKGNYFRYSFSEKEANYGVVVLCEYKNRFVLLDCFRYAHQELLIETVKGMGMKNKTPIETATIEVKEEIGGVIESIDSLGILRNDVSDALIHCFHAKISSFQDTDHEETEVIENIRLKTRSEIKDMIKTNQIEDLVTLALFAKIL